MTAPFECHPVITSGRSPVRLSMAIALSTAFFMVAAPMVKHAISLQDSRQAHASPPIHLTGTSDVAGTDHFLATVAEDLTADAATIEHYRRSSAPIRLW